MTPTTKGALLGAAQALIAAGTMLLGLQGADIQTRGLGAVLLVVGALLTLIRERMKAQGQLPAETEPPKETGP